MYTGEAPWEPYSAEFEESEKAAEQFAERNVNSLITNREIFSVTVESTSGLQDRLAPQLTVPWIEDSVERGESESSDKVNGDSAVHVNATSTGTRQPVVSHEVLSRRWGIGLKTAKKTI